MKQVVILIDPPGPDVTREFTETGQENSGPGRADEEDSLYQARSVAESLRNLGLTPEILPFRPGQWPSAGRGGRPDLVFNLVESERDGGRIALAVPEILAGWGICFTGGSSSALRLTTDKITAKKIMARNGILTLPWFSGSSEDSGASGLESHDEPDEFPGPGEYILKPVDTDASLGMDAGSVRFLSSGEQAETELNCLRERFGYRFFAEQFADGREFNISLISRNGVPEVLKPAEIVFTNFEGRRKLVDFKAKWDTNSFEYRNTPRSFVFTRDDISLLEELSETALRCWDVFGLGGYARVDFRCDEAGHPWVLEVNQNPCVSPDSGFAAAASESGISYDELIGIIAEEALRTSRDQEAGLGSGIRGADERKRCD